VLYLKGNGLSPKTILPISTNMMSGCINQARQRRRPSLPATLNHRHGMDPAKISPGMHTHAHLHTTHKDALQ